MTSSPDVVSRLIGSVITVPTTVPCVSYIAIPLDRPLGWVPETANAPPRSGRCIRLCRGSRPEKRPAG